MSRAAVDALIDRCLRMLEQGRPVSEVAAVLRAGYLYLRVAAATTGMPWGPARVNAAMRTVLVVSAEVAADVAREAAAAQGVAA